MAWQATLKEVAVEKKKRVEKALRKHGREVEIAWRVWVGKSRSNVEAELESEDPTKVGDDTSSSKDERG